MGRISVHATRWSILSCIVASARLHCIADCDIRGEATWTKLLETMDEIEQMTPIMKTRVMEDEDEGGS